MTDPNIEGCLVAGRQGLCVEASGKSDPNTAGVLVAISDQAAKLEPNCHPPTVILDYGDKCVYGLTNLFINTDHCSPFAVATTFRSTASQWPC